MKIRNFIFWSHLYIGIAVGIIILGVSVTGMMLSYRPQIIAFAEQKMVSSGQVPDKSSPVRVFMKKVEGWHRWFGLQGDLKPLAHNVKTFSTILFLVMIVSGFYLWWPRKIVQLKSGLHDKALDWNRHNAVGFWSAPFLIVITVTGIIIAFPPKKQIRPPEQKMDIVKEQPTAQQDEVRKFRKLVKTIHTGEAGGLIGQSIIFLATGGAVMLVWTGLSMTRRRFLARKV